MLRTAFGPAIARFLVIEVMLNLDGRLWIDRLSGGLAETGERLSAPDGERIVRLVAHHVGAEVHAGSPRVSAELPETGERFEGLLPPVVAAPVCVPKIGNGDGGRRGWGVPLCFRPAEAGGQPARPCPMTDAF
jgi:Flp pilus assembly CpaF family ATPase